MTRVFLLFSILVGTSACSTPQTIVSTTNDSEVLEGDELRDKMPELIGGIGGLQRHVNPRVCPYDGRVVVIFVVDENGNVTEPRVQQSLGDGCDQEAIRVMTEHAKFIPGQQHGRLIEVTMTLPIIFKKR
ncbi:MAG: energy transducer TonB [Rhodothermaceae bacterium]|nr:energy transducer TonB [Rhodothermaceae bacterium]MXW32576.1 energy transducer TonB [Rhodothermaceae bacterium]MYC04601.1 energy transducer TonB [Rhodothermaceae bacterium]MYE62364.1 energy transducer TonB [Rhodothermaceae bacterium]MYI16711.1 energy transducer TonB [Rhodothermaceae bacterium]